MSAIHLGWLQRCFWPRAVAASEEATVVEARVEAMGAEERPVGMGPAGLVAARAVGARAAGRAVAATVATTVAVVRVVARVAARAAEATAVGARAAGRVVVAKAVVATVVGAMAVLEDFVAAAVVVTVVSMIVEVVPVVPVSSVGEYGCAIGIGPCCFSFGPRDRSRRSAASGAINNQRQARNRDLSTDQPPPKQPHEADHCSAGAGSAGQSKQRAGSGAG